MILVGFILGVLFVLISVSVSIWLSTIKKDPLTLARAISASLPRPHAKIFNPKTDEERAREEKLGKHASEGGVDLEELL